MEDFSAYINRINKIKKKLSKEKYDAILITDLANIRYLTGFCGSFALLLVTHKKPVFLTDGRYINYVNKMLPQIFTIELIKSNVGASLKKQVKIFNIKRLAIEACSLSIEKYQILEKALSGINLVNSYKVVENIRKIKEEAEIELIREACNITQLVFEEIISIIKKNKKLTEYELCIELEYLIREKGAELAFEPIVSSSINTANPHIKSSKDYIKDILLIDFGINYKGYHSDITRTILLEPDKRVELLFKVVEQTRKEVIATVKEGIKASQLYKLAKRVFAEYNLDRFFLHNLGHGIGLQVHELPPLSRNCNVMLKENMVLTIEPGLYIEDVGGVRIEDMVIIKKGGCEVLTDSLPIFI